MWPWGLLTKPLRRLARTFVKPDRVSNELTSHELPVVARAGG